MESSPFYGGNLENEPTFFIFPDVNVGVIAERMSFQLWSRWLVTM